MKKTMAAILVVFVGLLSACGPVSSLNPLFTDKDVVFDPGLVGEWTTGSDSDNFTLRFEQDGPTGYRVIDTEFDGEGSISKQTLFRAHLVSLNGYRFLDVVPDLVSAQTAPYRMKLARRQPIDSPDPQAEATSRLVRLDDGLYAEVTGDSSSAAGFEMSLRQAHWIFDVQIVGGDLSLAGLDEDWLKSAIAKGHVSVAHSTTSDESRDLVLTASTRELQRLVVEHALDDKAFEQATELHRLN